MTWDGVERRKSMCPVCLSHRAQSIGTTEGARSKTIDYECAQCGFQWRVDYDAPAHEPESEADKDWLE